MSFRELREFTEIMRALGYPRRISVENFRTPNFHLVADILFWLVHKYDPLVNLTDNIETEHDRVDFLVQVANVFGTKARITLKCKNLYSADGKAVKELLKVARTLYRAMRLNETSTGKEVEDEEGTFNSSSLSDLKATRLIANEITDRGAKLYDLLGNEDEMRDARTKALRFLDAVASNLDSRSEHAYLERTVRDTITAAKENVAALNRQVSELKADETALEAKIKKKTSELDRNEKRFKSMQNVRPAFMDEYEKLERELVEEYEIYLERFRNLDFLEHELDKYQQAEREKLEASDRALKKLQKKLRDEELRMFIGDQPDVGGEESKIGAGALQRQAQPRPSGAVGRRQDDRPTGPTMQGSMTGDGDDSDSESSLGSSDSGDVSLGDSLSDDGSGSGGSSVLVDDDDDASSSLGDDSLSSSSDDF